MQGARKQSDGTVNAKMSNLCFEITLLTDRMTTVALTCTGLIIMLNKSSINAITHTHTHTHKAELKLI